MSFASWIRSLNSITTRPQTRRKRPAYRAGGRTGQQPARSQPRLEVLEDRIALSVGAYIDNTQHVLTVFNPVNPSVLGSVSLPTTSSDETLGVAITPDQSTAFVSDFEGQQIWAVNLNSMGLSSGTNPIPVSTDPEAMAITPDGQFLIATDGGGSSPVCVVSIATGTQVSTYSTGTDNTAVAVGPDGDVLVGEYYAGVVERFSIDSTGTLTDTGQSLSLPNAFNVVLAPDGQTGIAMALYGGSIESFSVSGMTPVDTVSFSDNPISSTALG